MDWLIWLPILPVILLFFFYGLYARSIIRNKDEQIKKLNQKTNELSQKLKERNESTPNRRKAFRVELPTVECQVKILEVKDKALNHLQHKIFSGTIDDISAGGLQLSTEYDFPIQNPIKVNIDFQINDEPFTLEGMMVRKQDHIKDPLIHYGVRFVDIGQKEEQQLQLTLNAILLDKKKV